MKIDAWRALTIVVLGALFLYFATCTARAAETRLTWEPPTTYCDGTPLDGIASYRILWGPHNEVVPDGTVKEYRVFGLTPGNWWFSVAAVDTHGTEGIFATAYRAVKPEEFVAAATTAYTLVKKRDGLIMLPVGTVPLGTVCLAAHNANGYYVVPRASVTFTGNVKPEVVFATCG